MQFWRGKLWVFIALLALCGPISPVAARVCAPIIAENLSCAPQSSGPKNCPLCIQCPAPAQCSAQLSPGAFLCVVSAPLPHASSAIVTLFDAPMNGILPVVSWLAPRLVSLETAPGIEVPPPPLLFGRTFSCRAPPRGFSK